MFLMFCFSCLFTSSFLFFLILVVVLFFLFVCFFIFKKRENEKVAKNPYTEMLVCLLGEGRGRRKETSRVLDIFYVFSVIQARTINILGVAVIRRFVARFLECICWPFYFWPFGKCKLLGRRAKVCLPVYLAAFPRSISWWAAGRFGCFPPGFWGFVCWSIWLLSAGVLKTCSWSI